MRTSLLSPRTTLTITQTRPRCQVPSCSALFRAFPARSIHVDEVKVTHRRLFQRVGVQAQDLVPLDVGQLDYA